MLVVLCLLAITAESARAAEIGCFKRYGYSFDGKPDEERIAEDIARKLWPSGFRPALGMCQFASLHGTISKGDYDKVLAFYRPNHKLLNVFELSSPGGDVLEAMKIGRFMRKFLITAWAPTSATLDNGAEVWFGHACRGPECACASACALIWLGAVERDGRAGLHRPRIDDPEFKALAPAEAAKVYRRVLDEIGTYLDEMEAPRPIIDAMVATDSSDIRWVDADSDRLEHPPSYAEWRQASCGQLTKQEHTTRHGLMAKQSNEHLTTKEELLLKLLTDKEIATRSCTMTLRFSHVEQLPAP